VTVRERKEGEREREKEREREREGERERVSLCARERERERECVCVRERESKREKWGESIHWHVFHCRRLFASSKNSNNKRRTEKTPVKKPFFRKSAIT
jgi:hypothetical protein